MTLICTLQKERFHSLAPIYYRNADGKQAWASSEVWKLSACVFVCVCARGSCREMFEMFAVARCRTPLASPRRLAGLRRH